MLLDSAPEGFEILLIGGIGPFFETDNPTARQQSLGHTDGGCAVGRK
jgi:hypothetical protein